MAELKIPDFLKNHSATEIFDKSARIMPADMDISEGNHSFNFLIAPALIAAEMFEFTLPEVIKLIFPEYSYGEFIDEHAKGRGMVRRPAAAALGEVTITGIANTIIPAGSLFYTPEVNDIPSMEYESLETVEIPSTGESTGTVTVAVRCTQAGILGNTPPNTIVLASNKLKDVKSVTNEKAVTGGTELEDDDSLIERIMEYDRNVDDTYTGSISDYKRWASSVPGVGGATIIPAQDDTGLVTIIITDLNGEPATEYLCDEVYNYIMRPDNPMECRAPINATISVVPPATVAISIKATVELDDDATLDSVKEALLAQLEAYFVVALDDGEVKYTRVASALASTAGANDFSGLQIGVKDGGTVNYGTSNIQISRTELPTVSVDDMILTAGTV